MAPVTYWELHDMAARVADLAGRIADTEDAVAATLRRLAEDGPPQLRERRLHQAEQASLNAARERVRANVWRLG
jgi:hypothetical protein